MKSLETCGLCLQKKELQNSHLLPAALYKQLREPSAGSDPNPVIVMRHGKFPSSKQISSPFLCADCELRFSAHGENYVVTQCAERNGSFKLRELLQGASPLFADDMDQIAIYDVQQLLNTKVDHFLYFTASVFWRASSHRWKMGGAQIDQISLGARYQEEFRSYLLGQTDFPQNARVWIHVSSETRIPPALITVPTTARLDKVHRHKFCIPGILFILFLGSDVSKKADEFALNGSKRQIMWLCSWENDSYFNGFLQRVQTATPRGRLRKVKA